MGFLVPRLRAGLPKDGTLVEVPGLSILAPQAAAQGALSRVILVDCSPRMLSYSSPMDCERRSLRGRLGRRDGTAVRNRFADRFITWRSA
jgi:hypothetical protein